MDKLLPKATTETGNLYRDALIYAFDQPTENIAETLGLLGFENQEQFFRDLVEAPEDYEVAFEKFLNSQEDGLLDFKYEYLPRATVEQVGQLAGSLAARAGGAGAGAGIGASIGLIGGPAGAAAGAVTGALVGGFLGPGLFEAAQIAGPVALARAKANGRDEPNWQDWAGATGTATVSGLLNAFGIAGIGQLNKSVYKTIASPVVAGAREGATEGLQGLTEQIGSTALTDQGLEIDPKAAIAEGIVGGTTGGAAQTPVAYVNLPAALALDKDFFKGPQFLRKSVTTTPKTEQKKPSPKTPVESLAKEALGEQEKAYAARLAGLPQPVANVDLDAVRQGNLELDKAFERAKKYTKKDKKTFLNEVEATTNIALPKFNPSVLAEAVNTIVDEFETSLIGKTDEARQSAIDDFDNNRTILDDYSVIGTELRKKEMLNLAMSKPITDFIDSEIDTAANFFLSFSTKDAEKMRGKVGTIKSELANYLSNHLNEFTNYTPASRVDNIKSVIRDFVIQQKQSLKRESEIMSTTGRYDTAISGTREPRNFAQLVFESPEKLATPKPSELDQVMGVPDAPVYLKDPNSFTYSSVQPRLATLEDGTPYDPQGILNLLTEPREIPESVPKKKRNRLKGEEAQQVSKSKLEAGDMGILKLLKERKAANQPITKNEIEELIKDFFARFRLKRSGLSDRQYTREISDSQRQSFLENPSRHLDNPENRADIGGVGIRGPVVGPRQINFDFEARLPVEDEKVIADILVENSEDPVRAKLAVDEHIDDRDLRDYYTTTNRGGSHPDGVFWGRDAIREIYPAQDPETDEPFLSLSTNENQSDLLSSKKAALGDVSVEGLSKEEIEAKVVAATKRPFEETGTFLSEFQNELIASGISTATDEGDVRLNAILNSAPSKRKFRTLVNNIRNQITLRNVEFGKIKPLHRSLRKAFTTAPVTREEDKAQVRFVERLLDELTPNVVFRSSDIERKVRESFLKDKEIRDKLVDIEMKREPARRQVIEQAIPKIVDIRESYANAALNRGPSRVSTSAVEQDGIIPDFLNDVLAILKEDLELGPLTEKEALKNIKYKMARTIPFHNLKNSDMQSKLTDVRMRFSNVEFLTERFIKKVSKLVPYSSNDKGDMEDAKNAYERMLRNKYVPSQFRALTFKDYFEGRRPLGIPPDMPLLTDFDNEILAKVYNQVDALLTQKEPGRTQKTSVPINEFKKDLYDKATDAPKKEYEAKVAELRERLPEDLVNFYETSPLFERQEVVDIVEPLMIQYKNLVDSDLDKYDKPLITGGQSSRQGLRIRLMDLVKAEDPELQRLTHLDVPNKETNIVYGQGSMVGSYDIMQKELQAIAKRLGVEKDLVEVTYDFGYEGRVPDGTALNRYRDAKDRAERNNQKVKDISNEEIIRRSDKGLALDVRTLRELYRIDPDLFLVEGFKKGGLVPKPKPSLLKVNYGDYGRTYK